MIKQYKGTLTINSVDKFAGNFCISEDVHALEQAAAQMAEVLEFHKEFVDAYMRGEFIIEHYVGKIFDVRRDEALAAYREAGK